MCTAVLDSLAPAATEWTEILPPGTRWYRGVGEEKVEPHSIGFDGCFWLSPSQVMARCYIPVSGIQVIVSLDTLAKAPALNSGTDELQQQLGYEFTDIAYDEYRMARAFNYPAIYAELARDLLVPVKADYADGKAYYRAQWARHDEQERRFKAYIANRLRELGYEPWQEGLSPIYRLRSTYRNGRQVLLENRNQPGWLMVFTSEAPLRIYDMTEGGRRDGDLLDVDYWKLNTFRQLEAAGYDGVKINDFAQVNEHGNVGHISIGLFAAGLAKVRETGRLVTTHPEDFWADVERERSMQMPYQPATQAAMVREASACEDQFEVGHPARVDPGLLDWRDTVAFDLRQIEGYTRGEYDFLAGEMRERAFEIDDQPQDYYDAMCAAIRDNTIEPVIVVEGTDGRWYPWDGNHRIGVAHALSLGATAIDRMHAYAGHRLKE